MPSPLKQSAPNASVLRTRVFLRDLGVCALCGWDTVALAECVEQQVQRAALLRYARGGAGRRQFLDAERRRWASALGFRGRTWWWEADHLKPQAWVKDDALENMRTLCVPCHVRHSAAQAGVLAKADRVRKAQADLTALLEQKGRRPVADWELKRELRDNLFGRHGVEVGAAADLQATLQDAIGAGRQTAVSDWLRKKARERFRGDWWIDLARRGGAGPMQIEQLHAELLHRFPWMDPGAGQLAMDGITHADEGSRHERRSEAQPGGGIVQAAPVGPGRAGAGAPADGRAGGQREGAAAEPDHGDAAAQWDAGDGPVAGP